MISISSFRRPKSLTYSFFILLVLGVFLLGYFYHYIPANKQTIHKDGFLILQTIAGNIIGKSANRQSLYSNFVDDARRKHGVPDDTELFVHLDSILQEHHIDAQYVDATKSTKANPPGKKKSKKFEQPSNKQANAPVNGKSKITTKLPVVKDETFMYAVHWGKDSVIHIEERIAAFLEPILISQRAELFDSYALAWADSNRSKLLYHDPELGIRSDVRIDTLLTKKIQGYLAGVRDIESPEFNHKIFYYSFKVGTNQLVLCGFTRLDLYEQNVRNVPFGFVYPLAITVLLLLVFLPILKFYVIDADEQVGVSDVILFSLSVFTGASVLTLVVIQYLLWQGGEATVRQNLRTLSDQINESFVRELNQAYDQVSALERLRQTDGLPDYSKEANLKVDYSACIRAFITHSLHDSSNGTYYHFDRISWIDNGKEDTLTGEEVQKIGQQLIKAEMAGEPVFTNVRDREYFRAFRNNRAFPLSSIQPKPNSNSTETFAWEPVYSHTKADFTINVSRLTDDNKYVVALASPMYSVVDALLPVGYGFCLIDNAGKVLAHADVHRNLGENLFQKVEPADALMGAVATRQAIDISEVALYQNWHMLHVRPIPNLPYSLVTFYDKGAIVSANMRILMFAVLFSLLSGLTCLVLWLTLGRTGLRSHLLLYCPMDCLTWLIPQQKQLDYYGHGLVFLVAYGAGLIAFHLLRLPGVSDYTRLATVLLTPVNVITGLFVIGTTFRRFAQPSAGEQPQPTRLVLLRVIGIHGLLSIGFYALSVHAGYSIDGAFGLFQLIVNAWMGFYAIAKYRTALPNLRWMGTFQVRYSLMLTALILCLSVLPSALYSGYAYRQEGIQTVKQQQLHLANDIRARSSRLLNTAGFTNKDPATNSYFIPKAYVENRFTKQGIYTLTRDSDDRQNRRDFVALRNSTLRNTGFGSFDRFYFAVLENLSNRHPDSDQYPALANQAADLSWQTQITDDSVCLWFANAVQERAGEPAQPRNLFIASALPASPFRVALNELGGIPLLILLALSGLLLWGLYRWLYVNTERVFLLKYIHPDPVDNRALETLILRYQSSLLDYEEDDRIYYPSAYDTYTTDRNRQNLVIYERDVLQVVRKGESFYEEIWSESTDKEKYLLHDFAQDGLLNYRNAQAIHTLLKRGLFIIRDERLKLFSPGFRAFLVTKTDSDEIKQLHTKFRQNSTWRSLQGPLLLLLIGFAGFIFFTQEAAFHKLTGLVAGLGTLLSLLPKLFSSGSKPQPTTGSA